MTMKRRAGRSSGAERFEQPAAWEGRPLVDRDVVAGRLLLLTQALQDIEREFPGDAQTLAASPVVRAAIERWLQVAIEVCIDVAYHVIADRGWAPPDRAADAFELLAARGMLDADLASRLGRAVGLRNVLVHEYVKVDLERLVGVIRDGLGDLRAFAARAASWLEEES
jgi:uncharacterized protein YutE (UPF0331/DUF86 family)